MASWIRSRLPPPMARLLVGYPAVADTALALVLALQGIILTMSVDESFGPGTEIPDSPLTWLVVPGAAWLVPFRRVAPFAALLLGAGLQAAVWTIGLPDTYVAMAVLLYTAAAHLPAGRRPWVPAVAVLLTGYTGLGVLGFGAPFYALPLIGLFSVAAVSAGSAMADRLAYVRAAEERARELERSQEAAQERALVEERARIARELHDVVAHGLSVIVVQAAAARRILERNPAGAAGALEQIEQTGRSALGEMRHVLGAIRTEPDESWQPARGLDDLDTLADEFRRAGIRVEVELTAGPTGGSTGGQEGSVPATLGVTAYRIVREALTNVLKHGGPGVAVRVLVERGPDELAVRVVDDGRGAAADDGGGHGLRGMQERVEVFGGRFRAGPVPGGGFRVDAILPVDGRIGAGRPVDPVGP